MRTPLGRKYLAALLVALACVLALAGAGWQTILRLRADVALARHTREVQNQIDTLYIALLDLENRQRTLLLRQAPADFEPYLNALRQLHAETDVLAGMTAGHAEQGPDLARLQALVQRRREELAAAIDATPSPGDAAALQAIRNGEGEALMTQIRDVLRRMDHEEARALALHETDVAGTVRRNIGLGAAAIAVAALMLSSIYLLMRRELAARQRAGRAEAEHRALLERNIELRSRELALASDALTVSEARLRGIFDSASDAILTVDASQTIVLANPAAARVLRCARKELIGAALERFVPPPARAAHRRHIEAFGAAPAAARAMSAQREVSGQRADGELFPIEAAISQLNVNGQELYTVILRDISERKRAEEELRRVQRELSRSHNDLQHLVSALGRVQEDERKRIARELHDDLQQKLAAILMNVSAANGQIQRGAGNAAAALAAADELAAAAIESTRRIVNDLRPQVLDDLGLVPALQALALSFSRACGMACQVQAAPAAALGAALSSDVATCLYRVAQESLNNVTKHTRASVVRIELGSSGARGVVLRVRDDGGGMDVASRRKPDSFGLLGMQERLRMVGGHLNIHSRAGEGTTIEAIVPARRSVQ